MSRRPTLVCGGLSFEKTPVEVRERAAIGLAALPSALEQVRDSLGLEEAVLISTCNRVEYFGLTAHPQALADEWPLFLSVLPGTEGADAAAFAAHSFHLRGRDCVEHLFRLAAGLESMVLGETEILGQVKDAYRLATDRGLTGKRLHRLFQASFAAAKAVRSQTSITRGAVSVGSVAVDLAGKLFGDLGNCTVMVLGAGATSERTARSLQSRGARRLLVANRTEENARALAEALGGEVVPWNAFPARLGEVDIVISSTSAPTYVLSRDRLERARRRGRPLFLIDLAVPRDIDPSVQHLEDVYLYDIDDLESLARNARRDRATEVTQCESILLPHVEEFLAWLEKPGYQNQTA
ncbi:MAG: glutamyl-tRNA reductase [Verrucomicrobium sp.]|nr:glutamyl-tRNA reductase [Verrucomicrobium sp.]